MQTIQGIPNPISSRKIFAIRPVFASQIKKLRKSFTWWNQLLCRSVLTPNSCTKFKIHSVHADNPEVSNPISSLNNFDVGPVFAPQIKKLRKSPILGGTNSFAGQFLHQTPVQNSRSIQCMQTIQGFQIQFLASTILILDQSLPHRSRNSKRALLGGTNSFAGQFLHQTPVQSSRSIQHMQTIQGFQIQLLASTILILDQSFLNRSRNSERALLGGTNSFAAQFLHQTPVQTSRSIQHMQTIQGFQIQFLASTNLLLDQSLLNRSRHSERALLGGTNSFAGQLLH